MENKDSNRDNLIKYLENKGLQAFKHPKINHCIMILTSNKDDWIEIKYWLKNKKKNDQKLKISFNDRKKSFCYLENYRYDKIIRKKYSDGAEEISFDILEQNSLQNFSKKILKIMMFVSYIINIMGKDEWLIVNRAFLQPEPCFVNKKIHNYILKKIIKLKQLYLIELQKSFNFYSLTLIIISYLLTPQNIF